MKKTIGLFFGLFSLISWSPQIWALPACTVEYTINSQGNNNFKANVTLVNQRKTLTSWKVDWKMVNGQRITNLNNGKYRQNKSAVSVKNLPGNGKIPTGASIEFDFEASYSGLNATPRNFFVNGAKCATIQPKPTPAANCEVDYRIATQWDTGFTATMKIRNTAAPLNGWQLVWDMANSQKITELWNGQYTQNGNHVTVTNANWNGQVATGSSVELGFNGSYSGSNPIPGNFSVNGVKCATPNAGIPTPTPKPTASPKPTATPKPTAPPKPTPRA